MMDGFTPERSGHKKSIIRSWPCSFLAWVNLPRLRRTLYIALHDGDGALCFSFVEIVCEFVSEVMGTRVAGNSGHQSQSKH